MRRLVFLDAATFDRGDVSFVRFERRWDCAFHPATAPAELAGRLEGAELVVSNKVVLDRATLTAAREGGLAMVAVAATGTNNVDLDAARDLGLAVANVEGYSTDAVAQHTLALLLELASRVGAFHASVLAGAWERSPFFTVLAHPTVELRGKTLAVVGAGRIGRAVAGLARAHGMDVLLAARRGADPVPPGRVALDEALRRADVLTLHCPLTPETEGLIGEPELAALRPGAFVLNASRGGLVDEEALLAALRSGHLGGAALDVLTAEPPPPDHPVLVAARTLPNLVLTPHAAWHPRETRQRLLDEVAENLAAFERGERRNRVA